MTADLPERSIGSGRHGLSLLVPAHGPAVIENLADRGSASVTEIAAEVNAGTSALSEYTRMLEAYGVATRRRRPSSGSTVEVSLTDYGRGLPDLIHLTRRWLEIRPDHLGGPVSLGDPEARQVVESRANGWANQILLLAEEVGPLTRGQMGAKLGGVRDPDAGGIDTTGRIDTRVTRMIETGQLRPIRKPPGAAYYPTNWARRGLAPVSHAMWLEVEHEPPGSRSPGRRTIEMGLRQVPYLLSLQSGFTGLVEFVCRYDPWDPPITLTYHFNEGCFGGLRSGVTRTASAVIYGTVREWLGWMVGGESILPVSGNQEAGREVLLAVKAAVSGI